MSEKTPVFLIGQLLRVAVVSRTKNTSSHWGKYTFKIVLEIGNYLLEQPVVLVFQKKFTNII